MVLQRTATSMIPLKDVTLLFWKFSDVFYPSLKSLEKDMKLCLKFNGNIDEK